MCVSDVDRWWVKDKDPKKAAIKSLEEAEMEKVEEYVYLPVCACGLIDL
jgi:hypothetical protein